MNESPPTWFQMLRHVFAVRSPRLVAMLAGLRDRRFRRKPIDEVFNEIYKAGAWGSRKSVSGVGSESLGTLALREQLPALLSRHAVNSMLDAPCGDLHWMADLSLDITHYYGVDIVPDLIESLQRSYSNPNFHFSVIDITSEAVPRTDLVLCRDCLVHLSFRHALSAVGRFCESGARFLLTTTYPGQTRNFDCVTGSWRALNLELAPFHFPNPVELINEKSHELYDHALGKSLGLWRVEDLPAQGNY